MAERRYFKRHNVNIETLVVANGCEFGATIINLSRDGFGLKFLDDVDLHEGDKIKLGFCKTFEFYFKGEVQCIFSFTGTIVRIVEHSDWTEVGLLVNDAVLRDFYDDYDMTVYMYNLIDSMNNDAVDNS